MISKEDIRPVECTVERICSDRCVTVGFDGKELNVGKVNVSEGYTIPILPITDENGFCLQSDSIWRKRYREVLYNDIVDSLGDVAEETIINISIKLGVAEILCSKSEWKHYLNEIKSGRGMCRKEEIESINHRGMAEVPHPSGEHGTVQIGKTKLSEGDEISVIILSHSYGIVCDVDTMGDNYFKRHPGKSVSHSNFSSQPDLGIIQQTVTVDRVSQSGNVLVSEHKYNLGPLLNKGHRNLGPLSVSQGEEIDIIYDYDNSVAICSNKEYWAEDYLNEHHRDIPERLLKRVGENSHSATVSKSSGSSTESGTTTDEHLRQEAIEDSSEQVKTTTTSKSTSEYSRSKKVKEYVKRRADGQCEGCGEPAPFKSKTGEPYLHAHHIHELSDGGSDTIDTVVALCPNCHYRVHHGEDGDEYNQELLEIVQAKENSHE
jgi:5-methylcytosine-specific restriction endonuclease McrA